VTGARNALIAVARRTWSILSPYFFAVVFGPFCFISVFWARFRIEATFYDSTGSYRHPTILGVIWGINVSLAPLAISITALYFIFRRPRSS
jgi:hypothetical protein